VMRKVTYILVAHLIAILAFGISRAGAVSITLISQNSSTIGRYEKFEVTFTLSQSYSNPFDPCVIDITATFHEPDGNVVTIPAFYYRYYAPSGSNPETYPTGGAISWKARFAPSKLGSHTFDITLKDPNGTFLNTNAGFFTCVESGKKGFIRIDPNQHDFLKYSNGDTYLPIGQNIGWNNGSLPGGGTAGWDYFLKKMHNAGANWVRLWSCSYGSNLGTVLEFPPGMWGSTYFQGPGKPSQQISMRMDKYVEIAEQNDIAIQFALQHHGQVSTTTNPDWSTNPYNIANTGGFLSDPCKYFTDADAIKLTKHKYRYVVARWGYSTAIYAWELFNEVQWTDGWNYDQSTVVAWHSTMASYIRSLDAFRHPVTTSSHGTGFENLWNLPDINLVEHHYYGNDTIRTIEQTAMTLQDFNKPVLFAEFGLGGNPEGSTQPEPYATQLKEGLEMHNGIWAAFLSRSTANLWWWDNYIDPCNLYGVYTPLAVYTTGENLADCNLTRAQRAASGNEAYFANPVLGDFWAVTTQFDFYLQENYFPGMGNLSKWLHGSTKSAYKSDPNFLLTMPAAGSLKIHVQSTANWTSNSLRVLRNGSQIFTGTYPADSNNFIITVPLSAGQQAIKIENTGQDWFNITSYEFAPNNVSLLGSMGLAGKQRGYYWIYDTNSQYGLINNGTFHNEQVVAKGLSDGLYDVDVYNTRGSGGIINSGTANSTAGQLTYTLPDFTKDIAVKVTGVVEIYDLAAFGSYWLQTGSNIPADFNRDGKVNFVDFNMLAGYWMENCPANWPL
jgi:hypothetical protein